MGCEILRIYFFTFGFKCNTLMNEFVMALSTYEIVCENMLETVTSVFVRECSCNVW
jgi:hypothetical protein